MLIYSNISKDRVKFRAFNRFDILIWIVCDCLVVLVGLDGAWILMKHWLGKLALVVMLTSPPKVSVDSL